MNCKEIKEKLNVYAEGNISDEDKALVENHLGECKYCAFEHKIF